MNIYSNDFLTHFVEAIELVKDHDCVSLNLRIVKNEQGDIEVFDKIKVMNASVVDKNDIVDRLDAGDETDLWELKLSKRTYNNLRRGGYKTIGNLKWLLRRDNYCSYGCEGGRGMRGFGDVSHNELLSKLKMYLDSQEG